MVVRLNMTNTTSCASFIVIAVPYFSSSLKNGLKKDVRNLAQTLKPGLLKMIVILLPFAKEQQNCHESGAKMNTQFDRHRAEDVVCLSK